MTVKFTPELIVQTAFGIRFSATPSSELLTPSLTQKYIARPYRNSHQSVLQRNVFNTSSKIQSVVNLRLILPFSPIDIAFHRRDVCFAPTLRSGVFRRERALNKCHLKLSDMISDRGRYVRCI